MKRYYFLLFLPVLQPMAAQNARQVTLKEALDLAAENSGQLKKAALDRQSIEYKFKEERAAILPQVSAGADLDAYPVLPTMLIPGDVINQPGGYIPVRFGQPWHLTGNVQVEQMLYSESYRRALPIREAARSLYDFIVQKTADEVRFQTAQVFYQTLQTAELLRSVNANLEKLGALQKIAKLQLENGYATPTDVKRISVAKTNLETQKLNLQTAIEGLQNTLKFLCGQPLDQVFQPVEKLDSPAADSLRWQNLSLEPTTLTEHFILLKSMTINKLRAASIRGERYPTLSAYGSGLLQTQRGNANFFDGNGRWFPMVAFGFRAKVPLFDGFRRHARAAQLDYEWLKLDEDRKQLTQAKTLEFGQAKNQYKLALRQLAVQAENVSLAAEIRDKFFLQYKEGAQPLSELMNTQTALSEAETNYWQQVFGYKLAVLKLAKSAGKIDLITAN